MISVNLWANAQAMMASAFMIRAMWLVWKRAKADDGFFSTSALLALGLASHGLINALFFAGLGWIAATGKWHVPVMQADVLFAVMVTWLATGALILVKTGLVWLGERRGRSAWWRWYLGLSTAWAVAGVML